MDTATPLVCGPGPDHQIRRQNAKSADKTYIVRWHARSFRETKPPKLNLAAPIWGDSKDAVQRGKCELVISDCDSSDENTGEFMYMDVNIQGMKVPALLNTGSIIYIISKGLFGELPLQSKFHFR